MFENPAVAYALQLLSLSAHISSCIKSIISGVPEASGRVPRPHKSPFENHYNPSGFQMGGLSLVKVPKRSRRSALEPCFLPRAKDPPAVISKIGPRPAYVCSHKTK